MTITNANYSILAVHQQNHKFTVKNKLNTKFVTAVKKIVTTKNEDANIGKLTLEGMWNLAKK